MLAALVAAGCAMAAAQAGDAIQFSDPNASASNLTSSINPALERMNPTPSGFKQAESDLFKPFDQAMHPQDSMQGVLSLPLSSQQQSAPDKHTLEMMDRHRNWAFTDLKDLYPQPSLDEMLGLQDTSSDAKNQKVISSIAKYYENLGQKPDPKGETFLQGLAAFGGLMNAQGSPMGAFNPVMPGFPGSDSFTKKLTVTPGSSGDSDKNLVWSGGSSAGMTPTAEEALASQKHNEDFRRMLDPSLPPAKPDRLPGSGMNTDLYSHLPLALQNNNNNLLNAALKEPPAPHHSPLYPTLGVVDPTTAALDAHAFRDPTAAALGMPNPLKYTPPPRPPETVKQMLDPFAAGMMKPRF